MLSWACQEALRPCTQDIDYEPSYTQGSNDVHPDDVAMDMDPTLEETTRSQEQPTLSSPGPATSGPATPGSSTSAATPPSAAVSSAAHRYSTRTPGPGAPAWKEEAGGEAQAAAREAERLRSRGKLEQSAEVVKAQLATEGGVIGSPYAARQAKAVATSLFANAGGLANAAKVMGKVAQLPEMRLLALLAEKPEERLTCTNPNPDPIPNPNPNPNPNPDPDPDPNPNPNPNPRHQRLYRERLPRRGRPPAAGAPLPAGRGLRSVGPLLGRRDAARRGARARAERAALRLARRAPPAHAQRRAAAARPAARLQPAPRRRQGRGGPKVLCPETVK